MSKKTALIVIATVFAVVIIAGLSFRGCDSLQPARVIRLSEQEVHDIQRAVSRYRWARLRRAVMDRRFGDAKRDLREIFQRRAWTIGAPRRTGTEKAEAYVFVGPATEIWYGYALERTTNGWTVVRAGYEYFSP